MKKASLIRLILNSIKPMPVRRCVAVFAGFVETPRVSVLNSTQGYVNVDTATAMKTRLEVNLENQDDLVRSREGERESGREGESVGRLNEYRKYCVHS